MQHKQKHRLALLVATFFGCGKFFLAPGTIGSLASLLIWIPLSMFCPIYINVLLIIILFFLGVWSSQYAIDYYQKVDPSQVVIDEVVGQGIACLCISDNYVSMAFAFLLFRFFDIIKPWPIKKIEKLFPNKWGIMLDDVAAGFMALILCYWGQKWLMII